jgi:hypothetical protein
MASKYFQENLYNLQDIFKNFAVIRVVKKYCYFPGGPEVVPTSSYKTDILSQFKPIIALILPVYPSTIHFKLSPHSLPVLTRIFYRYSNDSFLNFLKEIVES